MKKIVMGTREVYEEKLRRGNLDYDPTINPGLGNPRCPRCLSLLDPNSVLSFSLPLPLSLSLLYICIFFAFLQCKCLFYCSLDFFVFCIDLQENGEWTITSVLHDATAVVRYSSFFFFRHVLYVCA